MTWSALHVSVAIDAAPATVAAFAGDPMNLPRWAPGLGDAVTEQDGRWIVDTDDGAVEIRFRGPIGSGVLDHDVELADGTVVHNPMRVLANDRGCEVVFTIYRRNGMSQSELDRDAGLVAADLRRLSDFVEGSSDSVIDRWHDSPGDPVEPDPGSAHGEVLLTGGGRSIVHRLADTVLRPTGPHTPAVHALLDHLEQVGFAEAPRVVPPGVTSDGREVLSFQPGGFTTSGMWDTEAADALGRLLRRLHHATSTFVPPRHAQWYPWHGRDLGSGHRVIGHCDLGPWNIVARDGRPVGLIDWEFAGPVDPIVELAQLVWLNAKLQDDVVAEIEGLPPAEDRAQVMRAIVDGYGLDASRRAEFIGVMLDLVLSEVAYEADDAQIGPETTEHPIGLWAMAWRARSGRWILTNRASLEHAMR